MAEIKWKKHNEGGGRRVVVTKHLPGTHWLDILARADCRVEVCESDQRLDADYIEKAIGDRCHGVIGQLTEDWGERLFAALKAAGGLAYSNYAVGYNNVDTDAATRLGLPVGNTPGVLTETTAEMAAALALACARRLVEADRYTRRGLWKGWSTTLFLGVRLHGGTAGVVGAGRIGSAFARIMLEGFKMNVIYYSRSPKPELEQHAAEYAAFLRSRGETPPACRRAAGLDELLRESDIVSLHTPLDDSTRRLIDAERLSMMKPGAILVNTSRGAVVDEEALVEHLKANPGFQAGLDVYENEPDLAPGLAELDNAVLPPHLGSASLWTRTGMAVLAACNVAALIRGLPVWNRPDASPFLEDDPPPAAPSVVNADELGLPYYQG